MLYRVPFSGSLSVYFQTGVGTRLSWLSLKAPLDIEEGTLYLFADVNVSKPLVNFPVRLGMDWLVADDFSLDLRYSMLVLSPSLMHVVQVGVGGPF
jgi:hypothetical protein